MAQFYEMAEAEEIAARNAAESVGELERLLVSVFNDGDADGSGYLEPKEFFALLDTADFALDPSEKRQLLAIADTNGDGKIECDELPLKPSLSLLTPVRLTVYSPSPHGLAPCQVLRVCADRRRYHPDDADAFAQCEAAGVRPLPLTLWP